MKQSIIVEWICRQFRLRQVLDDFNTANGLIENVGEIPLRAYCGGVCKEVDDERAQSGDTADGSGLSQRR